MTPFSNLKINPETVLSFGVHKDEYVYRNKFPSFQQMLIDKTLFLFH